MAKACRRCVGCRFIFSVFIENTKNKSNKAVAVVCVAMVRSGLAEINEISMSPRSARMTHGTGHRHQPNGKSEHFYQRHLGDCSEMTVDE